MPHVRPSWLCRHALAGLCAPGAGFGALLHRLVVAPFPALALALSANLGADPASTVVKVGASGQEVSRHLTDLSTIQKSPDMLGRCVLAPHRKTILNRLSADRVAVTTFLRALAHLSGDRRFGSVRHSGLLKKVFANEDRTRYATSFIKHKMISNPSA
jgi:hypothetical protein